MAEKLFSYHIDNEEEAEAVRQLLDEHGIEHYSTPGSRWGFSQAAIWLQDPAQLESARQLVSDFQQDYARQARQHYQQQTGYRPDAPLGQRIVFLLRFWAQRPAAVTVAVAGLVLLFFVFYEFFSLLQTTPEKR